MPPPRLYARARRWARRATRRCLRPAALLPLLAVLLLGTALAERQPGPLLLFLRGTPALRRSGAWWLATASFLAGVGESRALRILSAVVLRLVLPFLVLFPSSLLLSALPLLALAYLSYQAWRTLLVAFLLPLSVCALLQAAFSLLRRTAAFGRLSSFLRRAFDLPGGLLGIQGWLAAAAVAAAVHFAPGGAFRWGFGDQSPTFVLCALGGALALAGALAALLPDARLLPLQIACSGAAGMFLSLVDAAL